MPRKNRIVSVDFSGTLVKPFVAEEANLKRYDVLGIPKPSKSVQKRQLGTKEHYNIIREYIEKKFGVSDNLKVCFIQNYGEEIEMSGKDVKTMIMTDLFRNGMYFVAAKYGKSVYAEGILDSLRTVQKRGYKIAIVSGVRKDIITGVLAITKCPLKFDYILGQDPVLSLDDNEFLNEELSKRGRVEYIIGDKLDDLKPADSLEPPAKSIFVRWGHPTGGEEGFADYSISSSKELEEIIK